MYLFSRKKIGLVSVVSSSLPKFDEDGKVILQPMKILARRIVKGGNSPTTQLLIQWVHLSKQEATWEFLDDIRLKFLELMSWGQDRFEGRE